MVLCSGISQHPHLTALQSRVPAGRGFVPHNSPKRREDVQKEMGDLGKTHKTCPVAFPPWKKVGPSVQLIAGLSFPQSYGWPLLTNSLLAAIQRTAHLQIRSSLLVRPSEPQTRRLQGARARLCVSTRCNTLPDLTRAFFCFPHRCPQKSGAQGLRAACFVNL